MANNNQPWVIRDVPQRIRSLVKSYAGAHNLSMAQALEFLIDCANEGSDVRRMRWHDARIYFKHAGLPTPSDSEAADLLGRAADIRQQHHDGMPIETIDTTGLDIASLRFASLIDSIPRGELGPEPSEPPTHHADSSHEPTSES